ncbi:hypothetical protein BDV98DRAFT_600464 [Pterulicium gracile]|uniref:Uncharacterized protein n=1 Tax=Pterulicium gracile TaxID=1884261 RepID=A0A5C3QWK9_9AGAR|nr:hypothetical protein BDV98DRAFT_600464 [Pterula gracilis]
MTLLRSLTRAVSRTTQYAAPLSKGYATVEKPVMLGNPPSPPLVVPRPLDVDQQVISASSDSGGPSLHRIVQEYERISGAVLGYSLPYESRPSSSRRCTFDEEASASISLVAHYLTTANGRGPSKITLSSAFAVAAEDPVNILTRSPSSLTDALGGDIRRSSLYEASSGKDTYRSGTLVLSPTDGFAPALSPVTGVAAALPESDLLLLRSNLKTRTLPMSPYPAQPDTRIRAHFVSHVKPENDSGWTPLIGGAWGKWVRGRVLGYRDKAGRESQPGTYDSLAHLLFEPPPTAGSSGGPIVDEESGAVVGVMLGTRMDSPVEGLRGWGVPSEVVYELFRKPSNIQHSSSEAFFLCIPHLLQPSSTFHSTNLNFAHPCLAPSLPSVLDEAIKQALQHQVNALIKAIDVDLTSSSHSPFNIHLIMSAIGVVVRSCSSAIVGRCIWPVLSANPSATVPIITIGYTLPPPPSSAPSSLPLSSISIIFLVVCCAIPHGVPESALIGGDSGTQFAFYGEAGLHVTSPRSLVANELARVVRPCVGFSVRSTVDQRSGSSALWVA